MLKCVLRFWTPRANPRNFVICPFPRTLLTIPKNRIAMDAVQGIVPRQKFNLPIFISRAVSDTDNNIEHGQARYAKAEPSA
jgi:hypothetical protein